MEHTFRAHHISVGRIVPGFNRVTPAANYYCDKLVTYLTITSDGSPRSASNIIAMFTDFQEALRDPQVNVVDFIREVIADKLSDELKFAQFFSNTVITLGMGSVQSLAEELMMSDALTSFEEGLRYAIHKCGVLMDIPTVSSSAPTTTGWSNFDLLVSVGPEQLVIPNNTELIDGMLLSEAVCSILDPVGKPDYCVCLDGMALDPYWDNNVKVLPNVYVNIPLYEDQYRAKPAVKLSGYYALDEGNDSSEGQSYLLFNTPTFIQGVQTMDRILKASEPSYRDLQINTRITWVPAVASQPPSTF